MKRGSLTTIFPDLKIDGDSSMSQRSSGESSRDSHSMANLKYSMRNGWPKWLSVRGQRQDIDLTIRTADYLREEAKAHGFPTDPGTIIMSVKEASTRKGGDMADLWAKIEDSLVEVVYGSNYIEVTGSNYDVTANLCRQIFRGEKVLAIVDERDEDYQQGRAALISMKRSHTFDDVIRSRQEIINHAYALNYAIDSVVFASNPITEEFLREVHTKLCAGEVLGEDAGQPGEYRTWEIAARHGEKKRSIFIRSASVPIYMKQLVADLQDDMASAEQTGVLDPVDLASRYCHRLVCIHPFGDGNGRMCRILLNILLLKYAGHVSTFGGNDAEREEYLDLACRASKKFHEEDMEVPESDKKGHRELARFTLRKSKKTLEKLWAWSTKKEGNGLK